MREIADLPLAEDIPTAFDSCRKGPRGIEWRDDKPAEASGSCLIFERCRPVVFLGWEPAGRGRAALSFCTGPA